MIFHYHQVHWVDIIEYVTGIKFAVELGHIKAMFSRLLLCYCEVLIIWKEYMR